MQSSSEINTISKRAARAVGYSWGVAEEVGKCISSIEMFGISGVENLNNYFKTIKGIEPEGPKQIEKTNKFQILGLIISVLGILSIVTKLDIKIFLSLDFNKGDIIMIGGVITWGVYSTLLKKKKFTLPLLTLVHVICTFGLICVFPQFLYEFSQGQLIEFNNCLLYTSPSPRDLSTSRMPSSA